MGCEKEMEDERTVGSQDGGGEVNLLPVEDLLPELLALDVGRSELGELGDQEVGHLDDMLAIGCVSGHGLGVQGRA